VTGRDYPHMVTTLDEFMCEPADVLLHPSDGGWISCTHHQYLERTQCLWPLSSLPRSKLGVIVLTETDLMW